MFTRIIQGELPGRFVYRDDQVVAFLTIAPIAAGHTLVVPVRQVDNWLDLPAELLARLMETSQRIGRAVQAAFRPGRVALVIAGFEVPHVHVHLIPVHSEAEISFARADPTVAAGDLDQAAARIQAALG